MTSKRSIVLNLIFIVAVKEQRASKKMIETKRTLTQLCRGATERQGFHDTMEDREILEHIYQNKTPLQTEYTTRLTPPPTEATHSRDTRPRGSRQRTRNVSRGH